MKATKIDTKTELNLRLRRIEGQVRGVQKMIEEERDCRDILQQLTAIRSAVHGVSLKYMGEVAADCVLNLEKSEPQSRQEMVNDLIELFGKAAN
jgi:DNA-binding FrmR family transcriptional regulator